MADRNTSMVIRKGTVRIGGHVYPVEQVELDASGAIWTPPPILITAKRLALMKALERLSVEMYGALTGRR